MFSDYQGQEDMFDESLFAGISAGVLHQVESYRLGSCTSLVLDEAALLYERIAEARWDAFCDRDVPF